MLVGSLLIIKNTTQQIAGQKDEQEQRQTALEQRYVNLQRECSSLTDMNNRLETELAIKENSLKHVEERLRGAQAKLENSEQKCEQLVKKSQSKSLLSGGNNVGGGGGGGVDLNDFGQKNQIVMAQYQEKHMDIEERLHALQNEIEDAKMELNRVNIKKIWLFC